MFGIDDAIEGVSGGGSFLGVDLGSLASNAFSGLGGVLSNSAGSIISSLGGYLTNNKNIENQDYWNNVAIELANSAHQRARADLEKAGLNPILAANQGSSTPSLASAQLSNPLASFGTNSKHIQDALTGQTRAEVQQAQADATTASAYAKNAKKLSAIELQKARFERDMAEHDANIAQSEAADYHLRGLSNQIESAARMEALTGHQSTHVGEVIGDSKEGWKTYNDLVQQYRNEAATGRYNSSLGRAVFHDVVDTVNSAKGLRSPKSSRRPSKRGSFSLSDEFKDFMEDVYRNGADSEYTTPQGKEWH